MINNPKDFFQQVRNLCEELGLKMKAISESIAGFISKSDAESTYLKKTDAQSTYLGKTAKAESAKTADTATSATSATKATQDANGAVISSTYLKSATASSTYLTKSDAQATYLGKDAKAQSATFADSATTATSANSALKATQDADGNVISGTYLKNANAESTYLTKANASSTYLSKSDASSTYLGKSAKAARATVADSAKKATQDGNGANIADPYLPKTGGTMTGDIKFSGSRNIINTADTGSTQIYGGTAWDLGSMIGVYGKSHSSRAGWIYLSSHDGTNTNVLVGKPDGTLQWGSKNVVRSVNGVTADASGNATVASSTPTKLTTGTCTISSKKIYAPSGGTWFIFGYYSYTYRLDDDAGTTYPTTSVFVCKQYAGGALIADLNQSDYTNHNVSLLMCLRVA